MKESSRYKLNTGRIVRGCRELGCSSATLGAFCVGCRDQYQPHEIDVLMILTDGAFVGDGSVWNPATVRIASERGTLCASMDTGLVYWSDQQWRDPATSVRERPAQWVYVPDEHVAQIHPEAAGLWPGEYLAWDGQPGTMIAGGPATPSPLAPTRDQA